MKAAALAGVLFLFACHGQISHPSKMGTKSKFTAKPTANDCTTEPNGDKVWYPELTPFFQEGYRVTFDSWPAICKAGKWITDTAELDRRDKEERPRRELLAALKSRSLTKTELLQVMQYGSYILVEPLRPFIKSEIDAEFAALLQLQVLLARACPDAPEKKEGAR